MSKIFENMVYTRLIWFLETQILLSPHQFGFRANRSTIDPLTTINTNICEQTNLLMVSLDIAKAYDSVWKHRILFTLQKWNLSSNILKFINNFLKNKTFEVKFRNTLSSPCTTENGLSQGSSLSVTLFLVVINDISNKIKSPVKILLYADDCNIF